MTNPQTDDTDHAPPAPPARDPRELPAELASRAVDGGGVPAAHGGGLTAALGARSIPPVEVTEATSDGHHTFGELYEYRMLYNAHAARGWLAAGMPVVKSWRHSDGEDCFGGGWFIVTATLPSGQVSNHYRAEFWDLFDVPAVDTAPEWDGHTPALAARRLSAALAAAGATPEPACGTCGGTGEVIDIVPGSTGEPVNTTISCPDCAGALGVAAEPMTDPFTDEWGSRFDTSERCPICRSKWSKHGNTTAHASVAEEVAEMLAEIRAALGVAAETATPLHHEADEQVDGEFVCAVCGERWPCVGWVAQVDAGVSPGTIRRAGAATPTPEPGRQALWRWCAWEYPKATGVARCMVKPEPGSHWCSAHRGLGEMREERELAEHGFVRFPPTAAPARPVEPGEDA